MSQNSDNFAAKCSSQSGKSSSSLLGSLQLGQARSFDGSRNLTFGSEACQRRSKFASMRSSASARASARAGARASVAVSSMELGEVGATSLCGEIARQGDLNDGRRQRLEWYLNDMNNIIKRSMNKASNIILDEGTSKSKLVKFVSSKYFQVLSFLTCFVSSALVALQLDIPEQSETWYALELWCLLVFSLEVLIRFCALRRNYFKEFWNLFDIVLLLFNVVDLLELVPIDNVALIRILRGMKVARTLRCWKVLPEIRRVSSAITSSISSMSWGLALLIIVLYMAGILSTVALRDTQGIYPGWAREEEEWNAVEDFNPVMYFGSVISSMYTLFNLVIQTEFAEFARAIWIKQPLLFICLAVFACCTCFGIQNFVITACVERAADVERELNDETLNFIESQKLETLKELMMVLFGHDNNREVLTQGQLVQALDDEEMRYKLEALEFPVSLSSAELFLLLDDTGTGEIPREDFMRNAVHLIASSTKPFEGQCLMRLTLNKVMARLKHLESSGGVGSGGAGSGGGGAPGNELGVGSIILCGDGSESIEWSHESHKWTEQCRNRAELRNRFRNKSPSASEGSAGIGSCNTELGSAVSAISADSAQEASDAMGLFQWRVKDAMQRATADILALANDVGLRVLESAVDKAATHDACKDASPPTVAEALVERLPVLLGKAGRPSDVECFTRQPSFGLEAEEKQVDRCRVSHTCAELARVEPLRKSIQDGTPAAVEAPQQAPTGARLSVSEDSIPQLPHRSPRAAVYLAERWFADKANNAHVDGSTGASTPPVLVNPASSDRRMTRPHRPKQQNKSPNGTSIGTGIGVWFSSITSSNTSVNLSPVLRPNDVGRHSPGSPVDDRSPISSVHI